MLLRCCRRCAKRWPPNVITQNGEAAAVLVDPAEYERLLEVTEMLKIIRQSEDDVQKSRVHSVEDARKKLVRARTEVVGCAHIIVDALLKRIERLKRQPLRGSPVPEIDDIGFQDFRQTIHQGYRIIYRSDTSTVNVLAVLYQRRDIRTVMMVRAVRK